MTDREYPLEGIENAKAGDESLIPAIAEDGSLFPLEKMEAHRSGQLHQAVSVFVFCGEELLIQRRATSKYHSGDLWANTCCSHPLWGELHSQAAKRRLAEELGMDLTLSPAGEVSYNAEVGNGLVENERVHIFRGDVEDVAVEIVPNPEEVRETRWIDVEDLKCEMKAEPEKFAAWFHIYLTQWPQLQL